VQWLRTQKRLEQNLEEENERKDIQDKQNNRNHNFIRRYPSKLRRALSGSAKNRQTGGVLVIDDEELEDILDDVVLFTNGILPLTEAPSVKDCFYLLYV
jgi:DUF4097 and DUF4098 domain-containing protein YvlB